MHFKGVAPQAGKKKLSGSDFVIVFPGADIPIASGKIAEAKA
jgi:hypothetical protein